MRTSHTIVRLLSLGTKRWSLRFAVASSVSREASRRYDLSEEEFLSWERGLRITASPVGGLRGRKSTSMLLSSEARSCSIEHAPT
jgi:hypothetical protein